MSARRVRRVLIVTALVAATCVTAAFAAAPGVYAGSTPLHHPRHMDIAIKVLHGGRRADWRVDVYAPCSVSEYSMGTTVGTDAGSVPPDPQIRFNRGSFVISRHGTSDIGVHWSYILMGHAVSGGFAGTVRYTQSWVQAGQHIRCDSGTLAWKARRTRQTFP
jgi:hypothetical protein